MNEAASVPGTSLLPDSTGLFTIGHLTIVALLALLVIAGLIWGIRNARARREAEAEIAEHNAAVVEEHAEVPATPRPPSPASMAPTELLFDPLPDIAARFAKGAAARETDAPADAAPAVEPEIAPPPAPPVDDMPAPEMPTPPAPVPETPSPAHADGPVTQLKGLGPKLAQKLAEHGITTVGQVAALTDDEAAALDARLGPFTGRMGRDRWQEQARFLAAGDRAGFEAVFGRL